MPSWKLCFFLFLSLVSASLFAQQEAKHFRNISVDRGLSQSTVFVIRQDSLGFIWMGTQDGLNRFDGKSFSVYRPIKKNKKSIQSYYIKTIFKDSKGRFWIGGNKGISQYHYASDNFTNYETARASGEWYISSIAEDDQHNIWAASLAGDIFRLDSKRNVFVPFNFNALAYNITKVSYIGFWNKKLLIGTDVGLFQMEPGQTKLVKFNLNPSNPDVNDVLVYKGKLWIATEGNGLISYELQTGKSKVYRHLAGQRSLTDDNVRSIGKDLAGNIWIGTFKGLSIFDINTDQFENYTHQPSQPYTISQNSVRCIYRDHQNGMWLGTFYGGANYYHHNDIKFNLLSQNTGALSLNDQVVSAIRQDEKGNFWIGTNDKGLNYWNVKERSIRYYTANENNPQGLNSNNIKAIAFAGNGKLLIGTHKGGMNLLDPISGKVRHFLHQQENPESIAGDLVYALLRDSKNRIWVGTRSGLDQFDPNRETFAHIHKDNAGKRLNSDEITYLFEDSKKRVWIGTTSGAALFYPDNTLFDLLPDSQLDEDVVNCIAEDNKHRIWVGTRDGISLFDEGKHKFITYQNRKEFLKGIVYGIQTDDDGNLWISTNAGLVKFNPDTHLVQSFGEKDGLQNNQFNEYAFCKAKDGMLLFGGIKGISYFYPANIRQQSVPLNLSLTSLELFNKRVTVGDTTGILNNYIDKTNEIVLPSEYRQFAIGFNAFNYISANQTRYMYKLEGFDSDWQQTDALKATYANIPSGSYTFSAKAIGPNGEASKVKSIKIQVLAVWYRTAWFYMLMFIILSIVAYVAYRMIAERIKALQQLRLERLEKEKLNYLNQVKMDFFTNVSHELRTPLTLILGPLEDIMKKGSADKWLNKQHELMLGNAKRLYNLVDQLFEFRKTEMGTRKLQVERSDMVLFVREIYQSFQLLAEQKKIKFTYESSSPKEFFMFDKDAMERILFNLLSNAFKYTKSGGHIGIDFSTDGPFAVLKVTDTGIGIDEADLDKIFDRFYQVSGSEMNLGSGVGLAFTKRLIELHHGNISVKSTKGEGSVFIVTIPMTSERYAEDLQKEHLKEQPNENETVTAHDIASEEGNENDMQRSRLLIVDDNEEIVKYLEDHFQEDFEVFTATDGRAALAMLDDKVVELVISDVMMPEMDGLHFCKRIKQNINTSHIPVVLLTAKAETEQQIKGFEMGADDYVTKPFSIALLDAKVNNLLRSRRRLKEFYSSSVEVVPENIAFNAVDEEFLKEAVGIVEAYLTDSDFSVDKFARLIGMSRTNLYLKFKALTGESATDFIKRIRFNKAIELMRGKRYTIAQITYMCGFNSPSYFSTAFKQYFGYMPSEYLEKNKT